MPMRAQRLCDFFMGEQSWVEHEEMVKRVFPMRNEVMIICSAHLTSHCLCVSHTQPDISADVALVKQHMKRQEFEQVVSGTGRILVFPDIQILNSSELLVKASG